MATHTSTEFVDWCVALDRMEWEENTKLEYYLAQIAVEIHNFQQGFVKNGKGITIEDRLIRFSRSDGTTVEIVHKKEPEKPKEYKVGPELMRDPKWAAVNANAKAAWGSRIGIKDLKQDQK